MKVQVAGFATLLVCLSAATHLTEKVIAEELLKNMGFEEQPNMKKVWKYLENHYRVTVAFFAHTIWPQGNSCEWSRTIVEDFLIIFDTLEFQDDILNQCRNPK